MIISAISPNYVPHFSGHETFTLRQMWLKKVFDQKTEDGHIKKSTFTDDESIARFGVGKNMVASMRHWALATNLISEGRGDDYELSPTAQKIFSNDGFDPYSENPSTAWFVHWQLAGLGNRSTTWFWLFNKVTAPNFTKTDLEKPLTDFAAKLNSKRGISASTLTRDIDTCIRSYAPRSGAGSPEDFAEPMLGELGLISEDIKGTFSFRRGPKPTLSDGMFIYALIDYWEALDSTANSMAFESIVYGEGSPGRVFKLDEESVAERLFSLEDFTGGVFSWTDTSGLRQVLRKSWNGSAFRSWMLEKAYT
ncbi:DUF4007 family protein [Gallionella capsiferriformans]|uniref:DUF4007 domain-containing protein n=1 Tax=Gallionella capsiferriformans (strain ES-2) TaxID=395494 RepID=D9SD39_GALCS|nr:DUF4007 family protein [Gallionella capsiferriformans]ADL54728.1 hypothetical protein Galf_0688 [Gallionella capsiferriformans ES-2]